MEYEGYGDARASKNAKDIFFYLTDIGKGGGILSNNKTCAARSDGLPIDALHTIEDPDALTSRYTCDILRVKLVSQ